MAALALLAPQFAAAAITGVTSLADLGATDTITWNQMGTAPQEFPVTVVSTLGETAVVTADGVYTPFIQGANWFGDFTPGEHVLYTGGFATQLTLTFTDPVAAVGAYIQSTYFGPFTAELIASNGAVIGSYRADGTSTSTPDTALFFGVKSTAADISQVQFHLTSAPGGTITTFGLGTVSFSAAPGSSSNPVPEPATWAMMIAGFGLAGAALRRRRAAITA